MQPSLRAPLAAAALAAVLLAGGALRADDSFIIVQSTTSTEASGLFDHILPLFEDKTGIEVRVVAVGTGQALKNAENCDGDVLFVHARPDEEKFVEAGFGVERLDVMYNDFVVVGPAGDPAKVKGMSDAAAALQQIARRQGAVRLARRRFRHAQEGAGALAGGRRRRRRGERRLVPRDRLRHGCRRSTPRSAWRPMR